MWPVAFTKGTATTIMHYFTLMKSLGGEFDPKAESMMNSSVFQALNLLVNTTKQIYSSLKIIIREQSKSLQLEKTFGSTMEKSVNNIKWHTLQEWSSTHLW